MDWAIFFGKSSAVITGASLGLGRELVPSELTGPLLLLASRESSYMTGAIIRVDGGYSY